MSKWIKRVKSGVILPILSALFAQSSFANDAISYQRMQLAQGVDADVIHLSLIHI